MTEAQMEADGWERLPTTAFSATLGPTWQKGDPGRRTVALLAGERIINDYGAIVHGGALMTFADIALGVGAADAIAGHAYVTVQLQYQFAGAARLGTLITAEPELVRKTSQLAFMRALFRADGEVIGSADGIFKAFAAR